MRQREDAGSKSRMPFWNKWRRSRARCVMSKQMERGTTMDTYKITLEPRTIENAHPEARPLLEAAQKNYGMIPNMYARMASVPDLLSTYLYGYERFRKHSGFTPVEQEVILLTISYENGCSYCMAAHSWVARMRRRFQRT
jgi:AhpD family alkylhydroperoxidase